MGALNPIGLGGDKLAALEAALAALTNRVTALEGRTVVTSVDGKTGAVNLVSNQIARMVLGPQVDVGNGANANDWLEAGMYIKGSSADSISNLPSGFSAGCVLVAFLQTTGDPTIDYRQVHYRVQICIDYTGRMVAMRLGHVRPAVGAVQWDAWYKYTGTQVASDPAVPEGPEIMESYGGGVLRLTDPASERRWAA